MCFNCLVLQLDPKDRNNSAKSHPTKPSPALSAHLPKQSITQLSFRAVKLLLPGSLVNPSSRRTAQYHQKKTQCPSPPRKIYRSGKVIIVTGGSSGLGKESVLQLAKHNPEAIYLTARTEARGAAAIQEIQAAVPSAKDTIKFLELDLGSFASVQKAAATFLASSDRLNILMNNAGLLASAAGLTPDGYETQFGSNYMGPSLFTKLLLPVLNRTAERPGADVRVVNLSSELFKQAPKGGILLDQVKTPMSNVSSVARYGQSKLADYYHTRVLGRLYPAIKFVGIHPGVVNTGIFDELIARQPWLSGVAGVIGSVFLTDVRTGVRTQLWASTANRATVKGGAFYNQKMKEFKEAILCDDKAAQELWDWTEREFESKGV